MKKLLASLMVLAMCAPAMALTFSTSDQGGGVLRISYDLDQAANEGLRGLALTFNVTAGDGAVAADTAYALSAGTPNFNTFIDFAADVDNTYSAVGQGDPFALITPDVVNGEYEQETFPTQSFALSMGCLDEAGVQAAITADGYIDVTFSATATVAIALDDLRGGAVGDNLGTVAGLPTSQTVTVINDWLDGTPVVTKTTAAPAIANRVNAGRVETFVASGVTGSSAIEYQFNWGDGSPLVWGGATQTHTYTYGGAGVISATGYNYNVTVQARLISNPTIMSPVSANYACASEAVKSTSTIYAAWAQFGRNACWAYPRNCNGDVNGTREGSALGGFIWVYTQDLPTFLAAYGVKEPTKGLGINSVTNGICADFNRTQEGSALGGFIRVYTQDLNIFLGSYGDKEPTKGPGVPVCAQTNYHYWTGTL